MNHPLEREYHDAEWGVPVYDDKVLFEFITLEGAQAGLSWITILKNVKDTEKRLKTMIWTRWNRETKSAPSSSSKTSMW